MIKFDGALTPLETADTALGGTVGVIQARGGFRFAVDSVLLARFAAAKKAAFAVDMCCGNGVVGLCLLRLGSTKRLLGMDMNEAELNRARRGAAWNGFEDRATFALADLSGNIKNLFEGQAADLVVCNPPYEALAAGELSPSAELAGARHEVTLGIEAVARAASYLLKGKGSFCAVYPAKRLPSIFAAARAARLEPKVMRLVHPREGGKAGVALLRFVKDGGEGLEVRPPLYLHPSEGGAKYSPEASALLGPDEGVFA